jgi:hypothetical protein
MGKITHFRDGIGANAADSGDRYEGRVSGPAARTSGRIRTSRPDPGPGERHPPGPVLACTACRFGLHPGDRRGGFEGGIDTGRAERGDVLPSDVR